MLNCAWLRSLFLSLFITVSTVGFWVSHHAPPTLLHSVGLAHPDDQPKEINVNITSPIATHLTHTIASPPEASSYQDFEPSQPENGCFAYVFYATSAEYACSALVNIVRLQSVFHTRHRIVVLVHPDLSASYLTAFANRNAIVIPYQPPRLTGKANPYYHDVLLKLVAFRLHHFVSGLKRILILDSDQLILQSLDHIFSLPQVDIAAPRAYWLDESSSGNPTDKSNPPQVNDAAAAAAKTPSAGTEAPISPTTTPTFTSAFMLVSLSERLWRRVETGMQSLSPERYDMDLLNRLFGKTALLLPGSYAALNAHWERNSVPTWYRGVVPAKRKDWIPGPAPQMPEHKVETQRLRTQMPRLPLPPSDPLSPPSSSSPPSPSTSPPPSNPNPNPNPNQKPKKPKARKGKGKDRGKTLQPLDLTLETHSAWTPVDRFQYRQKHRDDRAAQEARDRLRESLEKLWAQSHVVHFSAVAKPWERTGAQVRQQRPWAHGLFVAAFEQWRGEARGVCPGQGELRV
ncbi:MAG: hypothetical protein LQ342_006211 [Letrouitia transgressa]|nr:MAG: hypothetical protein LQ342_006211 [Letrouitia transgressa]